MGIRAPRPPEPAELAALWTTAVQSRPDRARRAAWDRLDLAATDGPPGLADALAATVIAGLAPLLDSLWSRGWQPLDVLRAARKDLSAKAERVAALAVLHDSTRYLGADRPVHPEWAAQLDAVRVTLDDADPDDHRWSSLESLARARGPELLRLLAGLTYQLRWLEDLPLLVPPPSVWADDPATRLRWATDAGGDIDDKVLTRIRALLAKAESTTFPEEAEALTAKAQDLISRHAVDEVLLAAARNDDDAPVGRRILIDDPYASAKFGLLAAVADANRCRAVFGRHLAMATVFGFAADLRAVEMVFTSLLVQATSAMVAEGDGVGAGGRERGRRYRRSFLEGYTHRVGQRLAAANRAAESETDAAHDGALLPVLAERSLAVSHAVDDAFPNLGRLAVRVGDASGWRAGTSAADRAHLSGSGEVRAAPRGVLGR